MARHGEVSDSSAVMEIGTPFDTPKACVRLSGSTPEAYRPIEGSGIGGSRVMPSEMARSSMTSPLTPNASFQPVASWNWKVPLRAFSVMS